MTDRDVAVLEALGRMKFAATRQLARLAFAGSRWAAQKRLRRLLDAGLIRVWVPRLDGENIYSLAPRGMGLLGEPPSNGVGWPTPRGLDGRLGHLLAANTCRVALAMTLPEAGGEIRWWRADWELAGRGGERLVPDGLFRACWSNELVQDFALEIDHASRAPRAFVTKILRYMVSTAPQGTGALVILAVGRDARWVERYRQSLAMHAVTIPVWFAALAEIETHGATARWVSPRGEECLSLRALIQSRNGSGA